jgi:hypothetical protein
MATRTDDAVEAVAAAEAGPAVSSTFRSTLALEFGPALGTIVGNLLRSRAYLGCATCEKKSGDDG